MIICPRNSYFSTALTMCKYMIHTLYRQLIRIEGSRSFVFLMLQQQ